MFHPTRPDMYWRKHDDRIDVLFAGLDLRRKDHHGLVVETYTTVGDLGSGALADTYSAIALSLKQVNNPLQKPTHVLKIFRQKGKNSAELEFFASVMVDELGKAKGQPVCNIRAVCAEHIFKDEFQRNVLVFPFEDAVDLHDFNMLQLHKSFKTDDIGYHIQLLKIAIWMCDAVRVLNTLKIYHRDIKLENMIVSRGVQRSRGVPDVTSLKLIDFGQTCVGREEIEAAMFQADKNYASLECSASRTDDTCSYECGTPQVSDPLTVGNYSRFATVTHVKFDKTVEIMSLPAVYYDVEYHHNDIDVMWPKFEMFSCAISIYDLMVTTKNSNYNPPTITHAERSTKALTAMLQLMTSPNWRNRPTAQQAIDVFKLELERVRSIVNLITPPSSP